MAGAALSLLALRLLLFLHAQVPSSALRPQQLDSLRVERISFSPAGSVVDYSTLHSSLAASRLDLVGIHLRCQMSHGQCSYWKMKMDAIEY